MIELKTYAGSNVTPQNDAIMNDTNTLNNGIYYGCNVTIKDATTLHINAGQGIVYGRLFEVLDSDIPVSLSPSGTLLGQLYVHIDLSNIAAPIQILVDTGETLADLEDDPQLNIDSGITDMQLATFTVSTVGMSDLVETFAEVEPIRAVLGDADISAIGDGSVKGAIRTISTHLNDMDKIGEFCEGYISSTSGISIITTPALVPVSNIVYNTDSSLYRFMSNGITITKPGVYLVHGVVHCGLLQYTGVQVDILSTETQSEYLSSETYYNSHNVSAQAKVGTTSIVYVASGGCNVHLQVREHVNNSGMANQSYVYSNTESIVTRMAIVKLR